MGAEKRKSKTMEGLDPPHPKAVRWDEAAGVVRYPTRVTAALTDQSYDVVGHEVRGRCNPVAETALGTEIILALAEGLVGHNDIRSLNNGGPDEVVDGEQEDSAVKSSSDVLDGEHSLANLRKYGKRTSQGSYRVKAMLVREI